MQPLYIGPFTKGLDNSIRPYYLMNDAFSDLTDAVVFRERLIRRPGFTTLARLRRCQTNEFLATIGPGPLTFPGNLLGIDTNGQIECGSVTFTLSNGTVIGETDPISGNLEYVSGPAVFTSGTINYYTGDIELNFNGALGAGVDLLATYCVFPGRPVMGLELRETSAINAEETIAFDTRYAYEFTSGGWDRLDTGFTLNSTDTNFIWSTNFFDNFLITNFDITTPDTAYRLPSGSSTFAAFSPVINGTFVLQTAKIFIPFKDRLIALNTLEQTAAGPAVYTNFQNRARWCANGANPFAGGNEWRDDIVGQGGFLGAPTQQQIVSAAVIKDKLVVYFERSTYTLDYTGVVSQPFVWTEINGELGAESTYSRVAFDNGLVCFGNVGLHTTNTVQVNRIDDEIPDLVFQIHNGSDGPQRVHGIRDYFKEFAYFCYPDALNSPTYPNRVLVYNYVNNTFGIFKDSFTTYGYFQSTDTTTWATLNYDTWSSWDGQWITPQEQAEFLSVIAGNQQGYTFILNSGFNPANEESLFITAINTTTKQLTIPNHNLEINTYVKITNAVGTNFTGNNTIRKVTQIIDANNIVVDDLNLDLTGMYIACGELTVINNFTVRTKFFQPFWQIGKSLRLQVVDFLLQQTDNGEVIVNLYKDLNLTVSESDPNSGGILGSNILFTKPETGIVSQNFQQDIWHRFYSFAQGQGVLIELTMNDTQMRNANISSSNFVMQGLVLYVEPIGDII